MGGIITRIDIYICENCKIIYEFEPNTNHKKFICKKCKKELMYYETQEIDPNTNEVLNIFYDIEKILKNPGKQRELYLKLIINSMKYWI